MINASVFYMKGFLSASQILLNHVFFSLTFPSMDITLVARSLFFTQGFTNQTKWASDVYFPLRVILFFPFVSGPTFCERREQMWKIIYCLFFFRPQTGFYPQTNVLITKQQHGWLTKANNTQEVLVSLLCVCVCVFCKGRFNLSVVMSPLWSTLYGVTICSVAWFCTRQIFFLFFFFFFPCSLCRFIVPVLSLCSEFVWLFCVYYFSPSYCQHLTKIDRNGKTNKQQTNPETIDVETHIHTSSLLQIGRRADRQGPNYLCSVEHEISKLLSVAALAWLLKGKLWQFAVS